MKRDMYWRQAKRIRLIYTLAILVVSVPLAILVSRYTLNVGLISVSLLGLPSLVWGIFTLRVDEYKPIYTRKGHQ